MPKFSPYIRLVSVFRVLFFCAAITVAHPLNSFPCVAFCGNGLVNGTLVGDMVDEYISTPSIDHLDQTLKSRAEQVTEEARKVLDKLLSDKLADLDALIKSNIDSAESKLRDLMKDGFNQLTEFRNETIEKTNDMLTKERSGFAYDLAEFVEYFIPALIIVAAISAIIGVLAVYLSRQKSEFRLIPYIKKASIIGLVGVAFSALTIFIIDFTTGRSNSEQMAAYIENGDFLEASFYARQIAKNDPRDGIKAANVDRLLLFRDAFYKPARGHSDVVAGLQARAREIVGRVWVKTNKEKIDRGSLSLIALLKWTEGKSRNSEYVAARIAAHVLRLPRYGFPLESELDSSMRTIIANYMISPLDDLEVISAADEYKALVESLPLTYSELEKSKVENSDSKAKPNITTAVRWLTLETVNVYYFSVESLVRGRAGLPSASMNQVNDAILGISDRWSSFLASKEYLDSSKTEKIFLLKVPLAILSRLLDYSHGISKGTINDSSGASCENYAPEDDKRKELNRWSDRRRRTVAGILPAPSNNASVIAAITDSLGNGPDKDKVPPLSLLALRTEAENQALQLTKELFEFEQNFVLAMSAGSTIVDCLDALPKQMKCGIYITGNIESAPCPDDDPAATTSECVTSILGVAHAVYQATPCPDMTVRRISNFEARAWLQRAIQQLAGLGVMTCLKESALPYQTAVPECQENQYRTPAYRLALERYGKDLANPDLDTSFSKVSLLPTS